MMKSKLYLGFIALALGGASAYAAEMDVSLSADFFSRYIWRGQMLGHKAVVQPSVTIGKSGASINVWGNMPLTSEDPAGRSANFNELDYTLDYSGAAGAISYSAGFILYTFPRPTMDQPAPNTTQELYASVGVDTLLSPSITLYRDIKEADGWYISAGLEHSFALCECSSLDLGASVGWGDKKYNEFYWTGGATAPGAALNDVTLSASLPFTMGPVSIVPSLSYVTLVESKIRSSNGYSGKDEFFVAGIGVAAEF